MPRYVRGGLAVVAAIALAWGALAGQELPDAVAALVLVAVLAIGWPALTRIPQPLSATLTIAVMGAVGVGLAMSSLAIKGVGILLGVLGAGLVVAFIREMIRPMPRSGLVVSLGAVVTGMVGAVLLAVWLWVPASDVAHGVVVAGCAAVAGAAVAGCLPLRRWWGWIAIVVAAGGAGTLVAAVWGAPMPLWAGALLGLAIGVVCAVVHVAFDRVVAARPLQASVAAAILPLAWSSLPVYALAVFLT